MNTPLLRVTYRLRVHEMAEFERIFREEMKPIFQDHDVELMGIWKTAIGAVGEYMELWRLHSIADFETGFSALLADERLQKIFKRTGPMVEDEQLTILTPVEP